MLIYDGFTFFKDHYRSKSCNWKCSMSNKTRCRARAITQIIEDVEMVKVTFQAHNHPVKKMLNSKTFIIRSDKKINIRTGVKLYKRLNIEK